MSSARARKSAPAMLCAALVLPLTAAAPTATGTGAGTEPPPITAETLAEGTTSAPFRIRAKDRRELFQRRITVQPGAASRWHRHSGEQVAVVESGTLGRYDASCEPRVYRAGTAFVEPADHRDPHINVNLGDEPLVLYVTDFLPPGAPEAEPAENPGCDALPD